MNGEFYVNNVRNEHFWIQHTILLHFAIAVQLNAQYTHTHERTYERIYLL